MIELDEIRRLPLHEKLQVMEVLWEEMSRHEEDVEIPQWQKDLLDEREKLISEGRAKFIDWEVAKKQIEDAVS